MKGKSPVINFHFQKTCTLKDRRRLKEFIPGIFKAYKTGLSSLDVIFCSDEFLLDMNKEYLQHDYFTDIITFDLSEPGSAVTGEIYISVDRVKDNAKTEGSTFSNELHRVIFHGVLHLCGLGDKKKEEQMKMRKAEDRWLNKYFSP